MAERFTAARADIEWQANTGTVKADIEGLRRTFRESTSAMSSDTLRLAVAQDKLDKALVRHGPASAQAKTAELNYRRELEQSTRQQQRHTSAVEQDERAIGRMSRGALAGSGVMRGLGRSVAFASASFLGGAGLIYAIRSTITAAERSQEVLTQTKTAVEASGQSWDMYGKQVERVALELSKLSGFDDEQLLQGFSTLIRRTGDVNQAFRLNALAVDVARGAHIDYDKALTIVLRSSAGQARGLINIGVAAKEGADGVELLRLLTEKFGGDAARATGDATVAQDRFRVAVENVQETIGKRFLPAVTHAFNAGADWLNNERNQERVMRDVNEVVRDGSQAMHGFATSLKTANSVLQPLVSSVGGFEHAAELAFGVWLVRRLGLIRSGIRGIGSAAAVTAAEMNGLAAAERNAANMKAPGGTGKTGGTWIAQLIMAAAAYPTLRQAFIETFPGADFSAPQAAGDLVPVLRNGVWVDPNTGKPVPDQAYWNANPTAAAVRGPKPAGSVNRSSAIPTTTTMTRRPPPVAGLSMALQLAEARARAGHGSLTGVLTEEEKFIRAAIADKRQTKANLISLYGQLGQVEDELQRIRDKASQDAAARQRKADAKAKAAEAAAKKAAADQKRRVDAINKALTQGPYATTSSGFAGGRIAGENAFGPRSSRTTSSTSPTAADIAAAVREAMSGLVDINQKYGSDIRQKPSVTVVQQFHQTPVDYFAEAYHARNAMIAAGLAGGD